MAGNGNRDVALTITAKNQATAAIDSVAEALKTLAGIQGEVGESAKKADGLLGELSSELAKLSAQAKGLEALGVVAASIDKASAAVSRMQGSVTQAKADNAALGESYQQAAEGTRALSTAAAAAKQNLDAQRATLSELRQAATRDNAAISAQRLVVTEAAAAWKQLQAQVRTASANENQLSAAFGRSTAAIVKQEAGLAAASANLAEIEGLAVTASAALGGVAASQEAVAIASADTAAQLTRVNAALAAQPASSGTKAAGGPAASAVATYRAQVQAVAEAKAAMQAAAAQATQLGAAISRTEAPTAELTREFVLAKAAAQQTEQAYISQARALGVLRGQTSGTFLAFSQAATQMQRAGQSATAAAADYERARAQILPLLQSEAELDAKSRSLGASLRALAGALMTIPSASNEAAEGVERMGAAGHGTLNIMTRMRNELLALTTAYVGFFGAINAVGGVMKTFQTQQNAAQRLTVAFGGSQNDAANEMRYVHEQAIRLGFDMNQLVEGYSRVAIAAQGMGFSTDSTRKIFTGFSEAARVSGMDAQQTASAIRGLFEMIDRGTINARNFNLQMGQQMPFAIKAMAEAVGVSEAKFIAMQKAGGGVAATEETLVKFTDILSQHFAGELPAATQTLTAQLGRFQTRLRDIQEDVAKGGFVDGLTKALTALDEQFKSGSGEGFLRNLGAAMGALAAAIPLVVNNFGLLINVLKIFIGLKVAETILNIAKNQKLFGVSFATASGDVARLNAALAGLGGETGTVAVAMARMRTSVSTTAMSMEFMGAQAGLLAVREAAVAVGTGVMSAALSLANGIMIGLAATARALWVAIGGFPGLIITGLTFIVGSLMGDWIGKLGEVNDLIAKQQDGLEKLQAAYAAANGDAGKLRDTMKEMSSLQIAHTRDELFGHLQGSRSEAGLIASGVTQRAASRGLATDPERQIAALVKAFQEGNLKAAEFKRQLNAIGEANPALADLTRRLEDVADKAAPIEAAVRQANAELRVIHGTANDADRAMLGLATAVGKVSDVMDSSVLDRYHKALLDLGKDVPGVAGKMAALQLKIDAVKDLEQEGLSALPLNSASPQIKAQAEAMAAALKAAADKAIVQIQLKQGLEDAEAGNGQKFVDSARRFTGDHRGNGELDKLFKTTGTAFDPKWCADFVNAILKLNGSTGTGSGAAKSFLNFGTDAKTDPQPGDIVVIKTAAGYHVGIYTGPAAGGRLNVIGGNQHGGQVNEESFGPKSVLAIRRPPSASEQQRAEAKHETEQEDFTKSIIALVAQLKHDADAREKSPRDTFIQSKLDELDKKVAESGPTTDDPTRKKLVFTPSQRADVAAAAGSDFDAQHQVAEEKKVAQATLELNAKLKGDAAVLTREQFILTEAKKDAVLADGQTLADLDAVGKKYADIKGKIFDLQQQQDAYNKVIGEGQQYVELGKQLTEAFKMGDGAAQARIHTEMIGIKTELQQALPAARAFAQAMGDPKMAAALEKVQTALETTKIDILSAQQADMTFADGFVGAFDKTFQALGTLGQHLGNTRNMFLQIANAWRAFAANFLQDIANMILKQIVLNLLQKTGFGNLVSGAVNKLAGAASEKAGAVAAGTTIAASMTTAGTASGASIAAAMTAAGTAVAAEIAAAMAAGGGGGGGGAAGIATEMIGLFHGGGVVGSPGGMSRRASPAAWVGAARFHNGGIPGFGPDEIPIVAKRNEEVLKESDPRHRFNGGLGAPGQAPQQQHLKIVNLFDHGQALSEALQTDVGERAVFNHVKGNRRKWQTALGVNGQS